MGMMWQIQHSHTRTIYWENMICQALELFLTGDSKKFKYQINFKALTGSGQGKSHSVCTTE